MGYLTTITIANDALGVFEENPEEFAKTIFRGINQANSYRKETSVGFHNYGGYINIQPSVHTRDIDLYLHKGGCVTSLNAYNDTMENLIKSNPEYVREMINAAKGVIQILEEKLEEAHEV